MFNEITAFWEKKL